MAGPEPSYQRVPLLPITHKHSSDSTLVGEEHGASLKVKPRLRGGPLVRTALVGAMVALLWLWLWWVSLRISWNISWRKAEDAAWTRIYADNSSASAALGPSLRPAPVRAPPANASAALVDFEIEGPADYSALAQVCNQTDWVPNRWFSCDRMEGGVGNVRNEWLTCVRYAVAGGASVVMPSIRLRGEVAVGEEDLHTGGRGGLEFYFDVEYFKQTMREYCPQMAIADSVYAIPDYGVATFPDLINFKDVYTLATGQPNDPGAAWPGKDPRCFPAYSMCQADSALAPLSVPQHERELVQARPRPGLPRRPQLPRPRRAPLQPILL